MPPRRSTAVLVQYALMTALVVLLLVLLASGASPEVFTIVFLVGVALAALPVILAGPRKPLAPPNASPTAPPSAPTTASLPSAQPGEVQAGGGFTIRRLGDADLAETAALLRRAFEEYRGVLDPPSGAHEENEDSLRIVLKDSRALVAVAQESRGSLPSDRIAGCVFYQFVIDHVYLFRLAVLPEYRRQGIASALIEQVETVARQAGVSRVQLGVRTALPENQAYYERRGYAVLRYETHRNYSSPTIVILEKKL